MILKMKDGKVNIENFPNETDYRNPNIAEIMANLGYVNRFGSGVNTVANLLDENGSEPAHFLLGDMTTFKVVVVNADAMQDDTDVTVKKNNVIVDVTEKNSNVIDNVIEKGNDITSRKDHILFLMRHDKRISVKQISTKLGVTQRTIFREIDILKSEGRIKREGSDKSGSWVVID